jgi:hypothetical protein
VVEDIASMSGRRSGASTMMVVVENATTGWSEMKATIAASIPGRPRQMFRRRLPIFRHRPSVRRRLKLLKDHRRRPPQMPGYQIDLDPAKTHIRDWHSCAASIASTSSVGRKGERCAGGDNAVGHGVGVIRGDGLQDRLEQRLVERRPVAAAPFGGRTTTLCLP